MSNVDKWGQRTGFDRTQLDTSKPVVVCDFDGVLNALNKHLEYVGEEPFDVLKEIFPKQNDWKVVVSEIDSKIYFAPDNEKLVDFPAYNGTRQVRIQWSSELVAEINKLIDSDEITFLWLTSWRHRAEDILAPTLGLHSRPQYWLDFGDSTRHDYQPGKGDAIERLYGSMILPQHKFRSTEYNSERLQKWHDDGTIAKYETEWEAYTNSPKKGKLVWIDDAATHFVENLNHPANKIAKEMIAELNLEDMLAVQSNEFGGISRVQWRQILDFIRA